MADKPFPVKSFGMTSANWKPNVDEAIAGLREELDFEKLDYPRGYFLPQFETENITVKEETKVVESSNYVGAQLLTKGVDAKTKPNASGVRRCRVWKINMPGFIYRSHTSGKWDSKDSVKVFVSSTRNFTSNVFELYNTAKNGCDHGECCFPINPGSSTYIMIVPEYEAHKVKNSAGEEVTDSQTKAFYFIPAYHYGNREDTNGVFNSDKIDTPIWEQTDSTNTTNWIAVPTNYMSADYGNPAFRECFKF